MTEPPEPEDKLDAKPTTVGAVNGPEDATFEWRQRSSSGRVTDADDRRVHRARATAVRLGAVVPPGEWLEQMATGGDASQFSPAKLEALLARTGGVIDSGAAGLQCITPPSC